MDGRSSRHRRGKFIGQALALGIGPAPVALAPGDVFAVGLEVGTVGQLAVRQAGHPLRARRQQPALLPSSRVDFRQACVITLRLSMRLD